MASDTRETSREELQKLYSKPMPVSDHVRLHTCDQCPNVHVICYDANDEPICAATFDLDMICTMQSMHLDRNATKGEG